MKNWIKNTLGPVGLLSCLAFASGCVFVDDDDDDDLGVGTLTIDWTIEGLRDPIDCAELGLDRMEILLYTPGDDVVERLEPLCEYFTISIDMLEGYYFGDATFVDSFDRAATLPEPLDDIEIIPGTELVISLDFPFDSFL